MKIKEQEINILSKNALMKYSKELKVNFVYNMPFFGNLMFRKMFLFKKNKFYLTFYFKPIQNHYFLKRFFFLTKINTISRNAKLRKKTRY